MRQRCYERFAQLQAERETTQTRLAALDHAAARDDDIALLDLIPLLGDTIDLHPEHIHAALYQAFDIQALYNDDMNQVTIYATITTSTPHAIAAILTDTGHDPTTTTADPSQPPAPATRTPVYPLAQPPICASGTQIKESCRWWNRWPWSRQPQPHSPHQPLRRPTRATPATRRLSAPS
jgi:hypothetical protein